MWYKKWYYSNHLIDLTTYISIIICGLYGSLFCQAISNKIFFTEDTEDTVYDQIYNNDLFLWNKRQGRAHCVWKDVGTRNFWNCGLHIFLDLSVLTLWCCKYLIFFSRVLWNLYIGQSVSSRIITLCSRYSPI